MDGEERAKRGWQGAGVGAESVKMFLGVFWARKRRSDLATARAVAERRTSERSAVEKTRQRPGTAKGLIFLTLEDETGYANVIIMPDTYEKYRQAVLEPKFVRVLGTVQNQDGIVHLRAEEIAPLTISAAQVVSHDFH